MDSENSRYSLLQIQNNKLYQEIITSDTPDIRGNKEENPGFIYAPYILMNSPIVICNGDSIRWIRIAEIRKRREKIEKIMNKLK